MADWRDDCLAAAANAGLATLEVNIMSFDFEESDAEASMSISEALMMGIEGRVELFQSFNVGNEDVTELEMRASQPAKTKCGPLFSEKMH